MAQQSGPKPRGLIIERILRDRDSIWRQVVEERGLGGMTFRLFITSVLSLAIYGAVLGSSHSALQAGSSAIKLPLLFLATLAICLPTLYLFNLIFGARLTMMQAVVLIMVCITVIAVLALAFAPISLFFLISADNYEFFKLLNVSILVLAAVVGMRFLTSGMHALNHHQEAIAVERIQAAEAEQAAIAAAQAELAQVPAQAPAEPNGAVAVAVLKPVQLGARFSEPESLPQYRPASMTLLYIWIALFGFVGTQLAWTLRPFFGSPNEPFEPFRHLEGTFYADIFRTIGELFGN
jgi:hypothetical protein